MAQQLTSAAIPLQVGQDPMLTAYNPARFPAPTPARVELTADELAAVEARNRVSKLKNAGAVGIMAAFYVAGGLGALRLYQGRRDLTSFGLVALGAWEFINSQPSAFIRQRVGL